MLGPGGAGEGLRSGGWETHERAVRPARCGRQDGGPQAEQNVLSQVTQHGACLGLGLAALGTGDEEVFEDLKGVLYTDSAVAGEAAGLALGLLCVGSASDKAGELLAYAHDTQHEKVGASRCRSVTGMARRSRATGFQPVFNLRSMKAVALSSARLYAMAPASMGDGRGPRPLLRRKTVSLLESAPPRPCRVRLLSMSLEVAWPAKALSKAFTVP